MLLKKIKPLALLLVLLISIQNLLRADEGMWLPALLDKLNITAMQARGLKLKAEDIYSINQACLKDAVVIFGGGCTGELVSGEGLILTNHHCGLSQVQAHSTPSNNLVLNGFWAKSHEEELSCPGLSVTFLVRMEEVTPQVLSGVNASMSQEDKDRKIRENSMNIEKNATSGTIFRATVRPLFYGNQYFLFVYKIYNDVRLVAAPPESIGKFGGDTDNWMWPRHTGDFSIFRIYAGKDNEPAPYSKNNVPYTPRKFLHISLKGVKQGDFTMVLGYPGRTTEYLTAHAVKTMVEKELPARISIRNQILSAMDATMRQNDSLRLVYTSEYYGISNAWKKWQGTVRGLTRTHAPEKKEQFEKQFIQWLHSSPENTTEYGGILRKLDSLYTLMDPYVIPAVYYAEGVTSLSFWPLANRFTAYVSGQGKDKSPEDLRKYIHGFYTRYNADIDKNTMKAILGMYLKNVDLVFQPDVFTEIKDKYKGNLDAYLKMLYKKSFLVKENKALELAGTDKTKLMARLEKDPFYRLIASCNKAYTDKVQDEYATLNQQITDLYGTYMKGIMAMQSGKLFYPDANFTMRVAYGKVEPYAPMDGVEYDYYTTLDGVMEKENPLVFDYQVPDKLHLLYKNKDYGRYGVNGTMPVCFIASNQTSGGNSGSPVLDGDGNLIGINFDRNWEGTMSDVMYDPSICRNIIVDIRYVLFIIDKYGDAKNLINEMNIIQ